MNRAKSVQKVAKKAKRTPGDWLKAPVVSRLVHYYSEGDLRVSPATRKHIKNIGEHLLERVLNRAVALVVISKKSTLMYKHVSAVAKAMNVRIPSEKSFEKEVEVVKTKNEKGRKLSPGTTTCIAPGTFTRAVKIAMGNKIKLGSKGRQALRTLVEQVLVELINKASRFTESAKRTTLYPEDVDAALALQSQFA